MPLLFTQIKEYGVEEDWKFKNEIFSRGEMSCYKAEHKKNRENGVVVIKNYEAFDMDEAFPCDF